MSILHAAKVSLAMYVHRYVIKLMLSLDLVFLPVV
jgi:hypothetical protein